MFDSAEQRQYYRDRVRAARYAALADAEGFEQVCFALEELGVSLLGKQKDLGEYEDYILKLAAPEEQSEVRDRASGLLRIVRKARNDAMHTGAYARHATAKAVELCLILEDSIMVGQSRLVRHHMVSEPVTVKDWQPVGRARQLMLLHSFSNLPVFVDGSWHLITELGLARYLPNGRNRNEALGMSIDQAKPQLNLVQAPVAALDQDIDALLENATAVTPGAVLWVVPGAGNELAGVISAFELM